jgi:hypothetical protein
MFVVPANMPTRRPLLAPTAMSSARREGMAPGEAMRNDGARNAKNWTPAFLPSMMQAEEGFFHALANPPGRAAWG